MKKRMKHRSLRAGSLLVSCLFLALAVGWICADTLFGASLFGGLTGRGRDTVTVTVPELTGQLYSAALPDTPTLPADPRGRSGESGQSAPSGLSSGLPSGLFDISVTYVYSREPARQILEQSPPPGARRKVIPGQRRVALHLTVSMGQPVHPVPDTVGLSRIPPKKPCATADCLPISGSRRRLPPAAVTPGAFCALSRPPGRVWKKATPSSCMLPRTPPHHPSAVPRWSGLTLPPRAMRSPARGFPPGRCSSSPPRISSPAPSFLSRLPPPPSFPPERLSRCLSLSLCRKKRGIGVRRAKRKTGETGEAPGDS